MSSKIVAKFGFLALDKQQSMCEAYADAFAYTLWPKELTESAQSLCIMHSSVMRHEHRIPNPAFRRLPFDPVQYRNDTCVRLMTSRMIPAHAQKLIRRDWLVNIQAAPCVQIYVALANATSDFQR